MSCFHDAAHLLERDASLQLLLNFEVDESADAMEQDGDEQENGKHRLSFYFKVRMLLRYNSINTLISIVLYNPRS